MKTLNNFKPILFSTPMVQAILDNRKNQTRRVIKPQPKNYNENSFVDECTQFKDCNFCLKHKIESNPDRFEVTDTMKSKFNIGDIIWVRETHKFESMRNHGENELGVRYKADGLFEANDSIRSYFVNSKNEKWKPSLFMPKEAARIFLKVTNVRIERLNDISGEDAINEGISSICFEDGVLYTDYLQRKTNTDEWHKNPINSFASLWEFINGSGSWAANPFVFVYDFERIEKPLEFI